MYNFNMTMAQSKIFYDAYDESIRQFGVPFKYIVADNRNTDTILGECKQQNYVADNVYDIYGYFESLAAFEGEQDLYSKFGIRNDETMHIFISSKSMSALNLTPQIRDLIFWADPGYIFEVTYVSREVDDTAFFMGGKPNAIVWRLTTRKYIYDNDVFNTGIDKIDNQIIGAAVEGDNAKIDEIDLAINEILDNTESSPWEM